VPRSNKTSTDCVAAQAIRPACTELAAHLSLNNIWAFTPIPLFVFVCLILLTGCAGQKFLVLRDVPANPLAIPLQLTSNQGPQVSQRTLLVLRRYALDEAYHKNPKVCLESLQQLLDVEVDGEVVYGVSELAYILGKRAEKAHDEALALDMFGIAVSNAYMYLFAGQFDTVRNPYDPQFRGACDLYNESLASSLRLVNAKGQLLPGKSYQVTTGNQTYEVATIAKGAWRNEDFERFEFVNEYAVEGLDSSGTSYGLGVPLIAVRKPGDPNDPREKYYPEGLSFPVTALLRVVDAGTGTAPGRGATHRHHCVLELHDPLVSRDLQLAQRLVPLQSDLSTALAYFLQSPQFREKDNATRGLLNPHKTQNTRGIFMLEPFDPNRIPVLMVHGLWSSPVTWMPMFNDLRSFSELRKNYQFWFYHYPTGQPFWLSATQFREDFQKLRDDLDPEHRYPALNKTVLVGHSMGGLVSRMQTIESTDQFWKILSDEPFEKVKGQPEHLAQLRAAAFFQPNESVSRVVTIGTPHRGSEYANDTTRWISRHLIQLPTMMVATGQALIQQNPGLFRSAELLTSSTSIDSLSPDSPLFPAMLRAPKAPWVTYHNIVGMTKTRKLFHEVEATGDGVVSYDSAHVDDAVSEIIVDAEHQSIHQTPKAILEVRRILIEHLARLQGELRAHQLANNQHAPMPRNMPVVYANAGSISSTQAIAMPQMQEVHPSNESLGNSSPFPQIQKQSSALFPLIPVGTQSPFAKLRSSIPKPMAGGMPTLVAPIGASDVIPGSSSRKRSAGY
jgi:Alpha/beta hydrolase family